MELGKVNHLTVLRFAEPGAYLGDSEGEVLLPNKYIARNLRVGDEISVFVYADSEDRPVATTERPLAAVGEFALMKVIDVTGIGAFVDWGLEKDLLIPFGEQRAPLEVGKNVVVRVVFDERSGRVVGSTKIVRYLESETSSLTEGQQIDIIVFRLAPHGATAIIDCKYQGLIPSEDMPERLQIGDKRRAFVKKIREDGRVAISLSPVGYRAVMNEAPRIMEMLDKKGGFLPYSDASSPEEIRKVFNMSKGAFKKILGGLMRDGLIEITHHGIRKT